MSPAPSPPRAPLAGAALALGVALAGPTAQAAPGLSGDEAIFDVPAPEVPAPDQMNLSLGLRAVGSTRGVDLGGLPVGLSLGLGRRLGMGFRMETYDATLQDSPFGGASLSARVRLVDPVLERPAVAVQLEAGRFLKDPLLHLVGVVGRDLGRLSPTLALGPRWTGRGGLGGTLGIGASLDLAGWAEGLAEASGAVDGRGLAEWGGKLGARGLVGPLQLSAWGGGGAFEGLPWLGGGLALALTSVDLRETDRDLDGVADPIDDCAYVEEDLDGWEDEDGCPDPDNDGDGILDADDPTPNGEEELVDQGPRYTTATPRMLLGIRQVKLPSAASVAARHAPPPDAPAGQPAGDDQEAP